MRRPSLALLGWLAATMAAVGIAYGGVNAVAGRVVDPLPPTLGLQSVAEGADLVADPFATPSPDAGPSETAPSPVDTPTPTATPSAPPSPHETAAPPPPPPTSTATTRSYALIGGSATLRFEPGRVTVVAAEPAQGFRLEVEGNATAELRVEFDSDGHRSRLRGWWEGGARDRIDEDDRGDDGGDADDDPDDDD